MAKVTRWRAALQLASTAERPIHLSAESQHRAMECDSHASLFLRSEQRKQNDVADGFGAGEQHGEPIDTEAKAAGRWHAMLERK